MISLLTLHKSCTKNMLSPRGGIYKLVIRCLGAHSSLVKSVYVSRSTAPLYDLLWRQTTRGKLIESRFTLRETTWSFRNSAARGSRVPKAPRPARVLPCSFCILLYTSGGWRPVNFACAKSKTSWCYQVLSLAIMRETLDSIIFVAQCSISITVTDCWAKVGAAGQVGLVTWSPRQREALRNNKTAHALSPSSFSSS